MSTESRAEAMREELQAKPLHDLEPDAVTVNAVVQVRLTLDADAVYISDAELRRAIELELHQLCPVAEPNAWAEIIEATVSYVSERRPIGSTSAGEGESRARAAEVGSPGRNGGQTAGHSSVCSPASRGGS